MTDNIGDLISREALKKALQGYKHTQYNDDRPDLEYEYVCVDDLNYVIDSAPTIEINKIEHKAYNEGFKDGVDQGIKLSASQKGEWIDCENIPYLANCSHCGYQMDTHEERGYFKFCPYCGADMRGEEE